MALFFYLGLFGRYQILPQFLGVKKSLGTLLKLSDTQPASNGLRKNDSQANFNL